MKFLLICNEIWNRILEIRSWIWESRNDSWCIIYNVKLKLRYCNIFSIDNVSPFCLPLEEFMKQTWYWAFKMICLRAHLIFIFACSEAWCINFLRQIKVFSMLTFLVNFFIIFIYKIVISIEVFCNRTMLIYQHHMHNW